MLPEDIHHPGQQALITVAEKKITHTDKAVGGMVIRSQLEEVPFSGGHGLRRL